MEHRCGLLDAASSMLAPGKKSTHLGQPSMQGGGGAGGGGKIQGRGRANWRDDRAPLQGAQAMKAWGGEGRVSYRHWMKDDLRGKPETLEKQV